MIIFYALTPLDKPYDFVCKALTEKDRNKQLDKMYWDWRSTWGGEKTKEEFLAGFKKVKVTIEEQGE